MQEDTDASLKSQFVAQQLCSMLTVLDPTDEVGRSAVGVCGCVGVVPLYIIMYMCSAALYCITYRIAGYFRIIQIVVINF